MKIEKKQVSNIRLLTALLVAIGFISNFYFSSVYIKYLLVTLCIVSFTVSILEEGIKDNRKNQSYVLRPLMIMVLIILFYK